MIKWTVKAGTEVYVQGFGEYITKKDIMLSYEVTRPLQQFPREVIAASTAIKETSFYRAARTRMFIPTKDLWPKHPSRIIAVHEESLHEHQD
jgi:hypothetical protein